jgi:2-C-methyl-D-erythritol 4-phosphate cytidylyltransferase
VFYSFLGLKSQKQVDLCGCPATEFLGSTELRGDGVSVDVIIVAGGMGTRLGSPIPKAFIPLAGKALFLHALQVFNLHEETGKIILVVVKNMADRVGELCEEAGIRRQITIVDGGGERWQSVRNGVLESGSDWVMVHDAARPFVTPAVIDSLLALRSAYRCVITATPEVDTIRSFKGDRCAGVIDRSTLLRVGTPQLFHRATLLEAFAKAESIIPPPTDEAALFEACGFQVGFAWGDSKNFKITTPADLEIAEALCAKIA